MTALLWPAQSQGDRVLCQGWAGLVSHSLLSCPEHLDPYLGPRHCSSECRTHTHTHRDTDNFTAMAHPFKNIFNPYQPLPDRKSVV